MTRVEGSVLDAVEPEALGVRLGVLRGARLVPVDLLVGAEVKRRRVVLAVGRAELDVVGDRLVLQIDDELVAVGQARTVEGVAAAELAADVHPQLAGVGGAVLLALQVRHVALVEADEGVLPREQAEPRQLLRLAVRGHAEVAAAVAVLLVGEVDLAVVAAVGLAVVELTGRRQVAGAEASELGRERRRGGVRVRVRGVVVVADGGIDQVLALLDLERLRIDRPDGVERADRAMTAVHALRGAQLVVHDQAEVAAAEGRRGRPGRPGCRPSGSRSRPRLDRSRS